MSQCCGECKWWNQHDGREAWGDCLAPLPIWCDVKTKINYVRSRQTNCPCFQPREPEPTEDEP